MRNVKDDGQDDKEGKLTKIASDIAKDTKRITTLSENPNETNNQIKNVLAGMRTSKQLKQKQKDLI